MPDNFFEIHDYLTRLDFGGKVERNLWEVQWSNLWPPQYDLSNFPLHYIITKFLRNIALIKRVLDTEMNSCHCFNFTEKLSYQV